MLHWDVLRTSIEDVLRTSAGDIPWRYIEDHMATSIGRLLGPSSERPWDVTLLIRLLPNAYSEPWLIYENL